MPMNRRSHRAARAALAAVLAASAALALCSVPAGAQWPPWLKKKPTRDVKYPEMLVSVEWLVQHVGDPDLVIADARGPAAYAAGHVEGAASVPADSLGPDADAGQALALRGLGDAGTIVCYADSLSIEKAAYLVWLLEFAGHKDVRLLDGGLDAWRAAGRVVETATACRMPAAWGAAPDSSRLATARYVMENFGFSGTEVIDARGSEVWGSDSPRDGRPAGHIPHSLPFRFRDLVLSDGTLRPPADMRAALARIGPRASEVVDLESEFVVHGLGPRDAGALGYLVMRIAGVDSLRYYPGGWTDWSSDPALPTVRMIGAEELRSRLRDEGVRFVKEAAPPPFVLLDVRNRLDFDAVGHIPGAVSLGSHLFADSLDAVLKSRWPGVDRARTPMVVYCYGPECTRSRNCTTMAARRGFKRLEWLLGGTTEWRAIGENLVGQPGSE
jgi:thiosulfate/3-mercaptopyruvate sulfurtransferase